MRYWPAILCSLLSFPIFSATVIKTQIHDIDVGLANGPTLILLRSGDVAKISSAQKKLMLEMAEAQKKEEWLKVTLDEKRYIKSIQSIESPTRLETSSQAPQFMTYEPTILNTYDEAKNIFNDLNGDYRKKSQCYNRAHVWAYESLKEYKLNSMKVFMFYTRKYIREYDFGWWFHVSPFTYVSENGVPVEKVLDYRFINKPFDMKKWTDVFMINDVTCPEIQKYSDYSQHENEAYCYLYKTSMHYYQPLDLDKLERTGAAKTGWVNWEIDNAYSQGFGGWW